MKKILAIIVSTAAIASASLATEPAKAPKPQLNFEGGKWSIRVFYGFNGGEIKDDGEVDSVFGAGLEYTLPNMSQTTSGNFHIGVEYNTSTEGLDGLTMQNYGIYGGFAFPLGTGTPGLSGLEGGVRAGYFNTRLENDTDDEDTWGLGFDAGLRYRLQRLYIELFYRQRPQVDGVSNNAIVIGVNFPIGN